MNFYDEIIRLFPTLNNDQLQAIFEIEGPILIISGPGTGKTLTLVLRALNIIVSNKAKPDEIILTTFTEKAAFELKDRINQIAKKLNYSISNLNQIKIGTIHNLCNDYISKFLNYTPLNKNYHILDELTQLFFIYENFNQIVIKQNEKFLGKWSDKWGVIKTLALYFNKITEELIDLEKLFNSNDNFLQLIAECYINYQRKLIEFNKVDFSNLQKIFYDLLNNNEICSKIKKNIKYIMIDEYQDTNYIQEQIFLKLAYPENNICVVGDEDQSLYRFRGATVRNILEFPKHFNNCKIIKLTINYRSHKDIIEKCNKFISSIDWKNFRFDKELLPNMNEQHPKYPAVFCIWGENEKDEANRIVRLLKFLKNNKIIEEWSDVAILLRSVRYEYSGHYINALKQNNIPYFSPRAKDYFENLEIKLLIGCFVIIFGFFEDYKNYFHKEYIDDCIKLLGDYCNKYPSLKYYLRRKREQIENLKNGSLDITILDYFYQLLAYQPFSHFLQFKNSAYNLSIFSKLITIFQDYYDIKLITVKNKDIIKFYFFNSFLYFLISEGIDEYEDPDNPIPKGFVQIMTIHQSKGLEFPVVIVGTLNKRFSVQKQVDLDLLPFSKRGTFETEEQITRFDRLRHYYVAFSRAQKLLVLTTNEKPQPWFASIWEGLDQYPYIEHETLKAQKFVSKPQFIPKKSFSLSQINVYEICPKQYLYYYQYQFQPSRSAQLLFGLLVHSTIEDIHRAILDNKNFSHNDIEIWFEKNYKNLLLNGLRPISKIQKENALKQVFNYFLQNKELFIKLKETEVEMTIEKENYIMIGKIDLLLGEGDKLEILDFKTQPKPNLNNKIIDLYYHQLCIYAYLIEEKYKCSVEKMYIYWTSEEKKNDALMEFKYKKEDITKAGKYFDEIVSSIINNNYEIKQLPDTEKVCKECDFRFYCSQNGVIKFKTRELEEV